MWKQCLNQSEINEFFSILKQNDAYNSYTIELLMGMRGKKGGAFFIYTNRRFQIVVSFKYTFSTNKWRVVHNSAIGNFIPLEAAKITFRKIREFMDERDCQNFYAYPNLEYTDRKIQLMIDSYPNITWELESEKIHGNARIWNWYRDPNRKQEDELWLT